MTISALSRVAVEKQKMMDFRNALSCVLLQMKNSGVHRHVKGFRVRKKNCKETCGFFTHPSEKPRLPCSALQIVQQILSSLSGSRKSWKTNLHDVLLLSA